MLNPEKFTFAQDVVEFAGFEITLDTVSPCKNFFGAITEFPKYVHPKICITDVISWFGLLNQVSYTFSMAEQMLHLENYSNQLLHSTWTINLIDYLRSPKL